MCRGEREEKNDETRMTNAMKKPHTQIAVQREPFHGDRFLFLLTHFHDAPGLVSRGRMSLERVTPENEMQAPDPTFHLSPEEAQHLLDELWRQGLRPTNAVNEQSALPYIQSHLEDMRRLVFETPQGRVEVREDPALSPELIRFFGKLKKLDDESRTTITGVES